MKKRSEETDEGVGLVYGRKKKEAEIIVKSNTEIKRLYGDTDLKRLYFGDNLEVLRHLRTDSGVCGKVELVYIDPPFATRNTFYSRKQKQAYSDDLRGATYIEYIRERLILLRELLSPTGSIYLHLDEKMVFEMKIIMDEVFGRARYRNLIVRKKCNPKNYTRKTYGNIADFILFYTKTDKYTWNRPVEPLSKGGTKEYQCVEEGTGRKYMRVPIHAPGERNGETGKEWRGMLPPPGKHWQYIPSKLEEMDARGGIYWSKNGNPRRKVYLDEHSGVGVQDVWLDFKDAHNQNIKITGYPTEKNPDLLRRIIEASSNPGDLVVDCFAGSGTTLVVSDELGRNWIGVDSSREAFSTILHRFEKGLEPMEDYVGKRARNSCEASLFDDIDDFEDAEEGISKKCIRTFSTFTLISDEAKIQDPPWKGLICATLDCGGEAAGINPFGLILCDDCFSLGGGGKG